MNTVRLATQFRKWFLPYELIVRRGGSPTLVDGHFVGCLASIFVTGRPCSTDVQYSRTAWRPEPCINSLHAGRTAHTAAM